MKKLSSILLAVAVAITMFAMGSLYAFADSVNSPTASTAATTTPTTKPTTTEHKTGGGPKTTVNGADSDDIIIDDSTIDDGYVTIEYDGDGAVIRWESNFDELGLVEGEDYTLVFNDDGTVTVNFLSDEAYDAWYSGNMQVNAVVEAEEEGGEEEEEEEETKASTTKKNKESKSPATGADFAVVSGGIALACAGLAVVAAKKKNND